MRIPEGYGAGRRGSAVGARPARADERAQPSEPLSVLAATDGYEDAVAMVPVGSQLVIAGQASDRAVVWQGDPADGQAVRM